MTDETPDPPGNPSTNGRRSYDDGTTPAETDNGIGDTEATGGGEATSGTDAVGGENAPGDTGAGERVAGSFLVTHADEESVLLRDVTTSRVHPLSENPGVSEGSVVEGVVQAEPPFGATWALTDHEETREIPVEAVDLAVTTRCREVAADQPTGELERIERAGEGELHVVTVPESDTDDAVADVLDDENTLARAARLGVSRVEIRSEPGVVVVRYLPE